MKHLFVSGSPGRSESCAKQVATAVLVKLQQDHPDAHANEIVQARRALIAELEQRRRAAALAP